MIFGHGTVVNQPIHTFLLCCCAVLLGHCLLAARGNVFRDYPGCDLGFSIGLGLGAFGAAFLAARLLFQAGPFLSGSLVVALALLAIALYFLSGSKTTRGELPSAGQGGLYVLLGLFGLLFLVSHYNGAGGEQDAWFIWNLKAAFLSGDGACLAESLRSTNHPDYPLVLPGTIACLWSVTGQKTFAAPASIAFLYALGLLVLLQAAATRRSGPFIGLLGLLFLLATPFFTTLTAWQYADIPLAFYIVGVFTAVLLHDLRPDRRLLLLAWVLAALACWTKNEGILFFCALLPPRLIISFRKKNFFELSCLFFASLAVGVSLVAFKQFILVPNDLWANLHWRAMLGQLLDSHRHALIGRFLTATLTSAATWQYVPLLFLAFVLILGPDKRKLTQEGSVTCLAAIVLALLGYYGVYLLSYQDLSWLMQTSIDRLFMHYWPGIVLVLLCCVKTEALPGLQKVCLSVVCSRMLLVGVAVFALAITLYTRSLTANHPLVHAVETLTSMRIALDRYHAVHGAYPVSQALGDGWDNGFLREGQSEETFEEDIGDAYSYRSDGKDYKLLGHFRTPQTGAAIISAYPDMLNTSRCCSFGFWTNAARDW
ncbi:MAG: hypothetical protein B193_0058 [Solidesulfovibrio magneticus str. Maddingley MBC34]|uniref:Glycosyltransferase RgtA/B/C/D-like domain-containing protein n=1 Tax=Solidesulfovibrio magneticus str. Maddingley MBC34 TaxID=1206767 RepID=K6FRL5_9BACT|nr:MAG: hypothetical protein B193_0058 [Solidesulfovibrio magneticus str. Maddingley MBC34]